MDINAKSVAGAFLKLQCAVSDLPFRRVFMKIFCFSFNVARRAHYLLLAVNHQKLSFPVLYHCESENNLKKWKQFVLQEVLDKGCLEDSSYHLEMEIK